MSTNLGENRKTSWNGNEIIAMEDKPVNWLIDRIYPQGFGFLAGRKKMGKSFMVIQAAIAITRPKGKFLGYDTKTGKVLYLSLEGSVGQIKRRMTKMLHGLQVTDTSFLNNFEVEERWRKLNKGGYEDLLKRLKTKRYVWVIIDTWQKSWELKNQNDGDQVTKVVEPLYEITRSTDLSITFVDHFRKLNQYSQNDVVDEINGSGTKGGVADTIWGLSRERGKQYAKLEIASRDTDVDSVDLFFSKENALWQLQQDDDVKPGSIQEKIVDYVRTIETQAYIMQISKALEIDHSLVSREVSELVAKGIFQAGEKEGKRIPYCFVNGHGKKEDNILGI